MISGGDNESDHSPLILDGEYKTVQDGDDNERLPWEFSEGEDDGDEDEPIGLVTASSSGKAAATVAESRRGGALGPPETLAKALHTLSSFSGVGGALSSTAIAFGGGGGAVKTGGYRRASSIRVTTTANTPCYSSSGHMLATLAECRHPSSSGKVGSISGVTENDSLTTSATTSPHEVRSWDFLRTEMRSPPSAVHRRRPSVSTLQNFQEFSTPLHWDELAPLDDFTAPLRLTTVQESNWSEICLALQDVRRLVLHHSDVVNMIVRKDSSMLLVLVPRILELIESPRSLVSKNAITALHDVFLFAPSHVPSNLIYDCLHGVLRRCTCNSFIAEEAIKCLKQIVIAGETLRVLHTLMTVLIKQGRSYTTLRHVILFAAGVFLLRLKPQSLNAVLAHRDFVCSFLKPVLRATNDASQDCRLAAAECCIVLVNLVPDLRFKFKNLGTEVDIGAALTRARRLYKPLAGVYNFEQIAAIYARCPDHAPIDLSVDRLQTALANVEDIVNQPLESEAPAFVTPAVASRSVTPSGKSRLSPNPRAEGTSSTRRPAFRTPVGAGGGAFPNRGWTPSARPSLTSGAGGMERLTTPPEGCYDGRPQRGAAAGGGYAAGNRMSELAGAPDYAGDMTLRGNRSAHRLSFESDSRKLTGRTCPEEFDDGNLPAYATRGNFRYGGNPAMEGAGYLVTPSRSRKGLSGGRGGGVE